MEKRVSARETACKSYLRELPSIHVRMHHHYYCFIFIMNCRRWNGRGQLACAISMFTKNYIKHLCLLRRQLRPIPLIVNFSIFIVCLCVCWFEIETLVSNAPNKIAARITMLHISFSSNAFAERACASARDLARASTPAIALFPLHLSHKCSLFFFLSLLYFLLNG